MEKSRIERIVDKMVENHVEQIIITSTPDIFYTLGSWIDSGERMMALYINSSGDKKFIVNDVCANPSSIKGADVISYNDSMEPVEILSGIIKEDKVLGVDKNWPSHFLIELMNLKKGMTFINSSSIVDSVRMIKDEKEKELMRNASSVVDKAVVELIHTLKEGMTENEAAENLRNIFAKYGTYEYSFDPIIAYGGNGADPHHTTSDTPLTKGNSVVIDIGGRTNNYCSDTTRTVFCGEPCEEFKKIYNIVLEANMKAIDFVKPGVKFSDIDGIARKVIEDAGYGKFFTHRTGHCIGIEDHEFPSVSGNNDMVVEEGMVFSIEPGIYIPEKYGVRIEDLLLVTKNGHEILNSSPKKLMTL